MPHTKHYSSSLYLNLESTIKLSEKKSNVMLANVEAIIMMK